VSTEQGEQILLYPHEAVPFGDAKNPLYWALAFPILLPFGCGGAEDHYDDADTTWRPRALQRFGLDAGKFAPCKRKVPLSLEAWVKHLLNLHDTHFAKHRPFMFAAFNTIQRKSVAQHTKLTVTAQSSKEATSILRKVKKSSLEKVLTLMEKKRKQGSSTKAAFDFFKESPPEIKLLYETLTKIGGRVADSDYYRKSLRKRIQGLVL
jgi:hypothetical protein